MRFKKNLIAILLSILLLFDAVELYRLVDHGWPKSVRVGPGEMVQVVRVPFTAEDWLILIAFVALHAFLLYMLWKSRTSVQIRH